MTTLKNVTVLGTGVLGSQIIFQTAYHGFSVTAYDISDEILEKAKERFAHLAEVYKAQLPGADDAKVQAALANITTSSDLAAAVADADIVIEAVPERLDIKQSTYEQLAKLAPEKTIFATNSSTLLPSALVDYTGRPDRFLSLHFANEIWIHNTAEIQGTPATSPEITQQVIEFAEQIGQVPIVLKKEKAGYVLNSLLVPLLDAALFLVVDGYTDPETVDKTWTIGTGAPAGPFRIFDIVGLTTAYNISKAAGDAGSEQHARAAEFLKTNYIDQGKLGVATGEGFYTYPTKK
ncbi:3-hydroxyacyl-CoA dehydrogenase [Pseudoclavibacter soli]|uniref:3-hydroxyacyl-CoA dehydrogenase n=1 Tax=Pseudoclavibacter soli TaxID=452623 RepID=UPI00041F9342|nr:3-hydroxyacyl-CoA dehydrogenase [Pseudoclavibacter soli]